MYKSLIRPILFRFDPERVHGLVMRVIDRVETIRPLRSAVSKIYRFDDPRLEREVFGIKFPNPVGLAAGFDKDAEAVDALAMFGFGFVEIGTLTPLPQQGNPKKRLFRLRDDRALINRMGFNNKGVAYAVEHLKKRKPGIIVGGNIGKNKTTPNADAVRDYLAAFRSLFDVVDYFTVNVSSPNTPGLRELQAKEPLMRLLDALQTENGSMSCRKPILLKIAPDLNESQLVDIIDIVNRTGIDGVIATNTTIERQQLRTPQRRLDEIGNGGLSGEPLRDRSTGVIRFLATESGKAFPIIGVGGIHSPAAAVEKLRAGADLIQLFTGFIYEGPALVKNILNEIIEQEL